MKLRRSSYCAVFFVFVACLTISKDLYAEQFRRSCSFGRCQNFAFTGRVNPRFIGNGQNFTGGFNRFGFFGVDNNSPFKDVAGFSNLVQQGNAILERNDFGEIRRLVLQNNGVLRGATSAETVRQLREFFLQNFNKFKGNDLNRVSNFLEQNGGLSDGRFTIDLTHFAMPDDEALKGVDRCEFAVKTLNFLLNTLQFNTTLAIPTEKACPAGQVTLDLGRFFNQKTLALMRSSDATSACTGKIRIDKLVDFMMEPGNYYNAINAPDNREDLSNILGVSDRKDATLRNKLIIKNGESGVASGEQRILEIQNTVNVGTRCYRSLDNTDFNATGATTESRDVTQKGILFTHDAEEWLCLGANGFMQGFLFNAAGDLLNRAPAEIAHNDRDPKGGGPSIAAIASCLDCHASGFIAGRQNGINNIAYTDMLANPSAAFQETLNRPVTFRNQFGFNQRAANRDFFINNAEYESVAKGDSNVFLNAQIRANAALATPEGKPIPVIPKMLYRARDAVTPQMAAEILGITPEQGATIVGNSTFRKGDKNISAMDRGVFESQFCNIIQGRPGSVLNEAQRRGQLGRETAESDLVRQRANLQNQFGFGRFGFGGRGFSHSPALR